MKRMEVQLTLIKLSQGLSCGRITRNLPGGCVSGQLSVTGVKMAYRKLLFQLFHSSERKSAHSWLGKLLICFPNIENIASQSKLVVIILSECSPACVGVTTKVYDLCHFFLASLFLRSLKIPRESFSSWRRHIIDETHFNERQSDSLTQRCTRAVLLDEQGSCSLTLAVHWLIESESFCEMMPNRSDRKCGKSLNSYFTMLSLA